MSRFPSRNFSPREPLHRRNGKIRAREVRVLDETKQPLGVMSLGDALRLAQSRGLDLIEIAPNATPPVCRIIEYGKFQYEESKRNKNAAAKQPQMKEIQLTANIEEHDFRTKLNHAIGFLSDDMQVRVKLRFRGRQKAHKEFGFEVMNRFVAESAKYGKADAPPKMAGDRDMHVTISPLPRDQRPKPAKGSDAPVAPKAEDAKAANGAAPAGGASGPSTPPADGVDD